MLRVGRMEDRKERKSEPWSVESESFVWCGTGLVVPPAKR